MSRALSSLYSANSPFKFIYLISISTVTAFKFEYNCWIPQFFIISAGYNVLIVGYPKTSLPFFTLPSPRISFQILIHFVFFLLDFRFSSLLLALSCYFSIKFTAEFISLRFHNFILFIFFNF